MSNLEPIRIPVDLTKPGQFFACRGLLELAAIPIASKSSAGENRSRDANAPISAARELRPH